MTESGLELVKAEAFQLYLIQYPNPNITKIASEVGRDRSRVSRWATEGDWAILAERIQQKQQALGTPLDEDDLSVDLSGVESFDDLVEVMSAKAVTFIAGGQFRFTSPNEIMRFLELAEKHRDRMAPKDSEDSGGLVDSSLPEQEAEAIKAGMLLIKAAKLPFVERRDE